MSITIKNSLFAQKEQLAELRKSLLEYVKKAEELARSDTYAPDYKSKLVSELEEAATKRVAEQFEDIRQEQRELRSKLVSKLPPEADFAERAYQHQRAVHALESRKSLFDIVELYSSVDDIGFRREIERVVELTPDSKSELWQHARKQAEPSVIRAADRWEELSNNMLAPLEHIALKDGGSFSKRASETVHMIDVLAPRWERESAEALAISLEPDTQALHRFHSELSVSKAS